MSTLGNGLVAAGASVGVATIAVVATGQEIVLSPAMIQLLIYKGLAAAAIGLLIMGSWIGRRGRRDEKQLDRSSAIASEALPDHDDAPGLNSGIGPFAGDDRLGATEYLPDPGATTRPGSHSSK